MINRRKHSDCKPAGMVMIDVLAGLMLLAALATGLAMATHLRQRAAQKFGDERQAIEIAKETLADLQSDGDAAAKVTAKHPGAKISVSPAIRSTTQPAAQPVGDLRWVQVTVQFNGRPATLVGVVSGKVSASAATQPGATP